MDHDGRFVTGSEPPLVSIGVPVRNGERFLEGSLDSILNQTYRNLEIVIIDNASTDDTPMIVKRYVESDMRIRSYRNDLNLGAALNYNRTFVYSHGTYFKWASSDDLIAPEYIAHCVETLERNRSAVLCYPKTVLISESGETAGIYEDRCNLDESIGSRRLRHLLRTCRLCNPVFGVVRAEALSRTPLIEPYIASDFVLLTRLALSGTFIELQEPLFFRREHSTNVRKLSAAERVRWFSPTAKPHRYPELHEFLQLVHVSVHIPVDIPEKLSSFRAVLEWGIRRYWCVLGRVKSRIVNAVRSAVAVRNHITERRPVRLPVQNEKSS